MSNNKFNSKANKGLIWNILLDSGVFNELEDDKYQQVLKTFENIILSLEKSDKSVIDKNKIVLKQFSKELYKLKQKKELIPISAEEISNERQNEFNLKLNEKRNDFEKSMNVESPNTIDFTDKLDAPIKGEISEIIESMRLKRESDLNRVIDKNEIKNAKLWLNSENEKESTNDNKKINIASSEVINDDLFNKFKPKENNEELKLQLREKLKNIREEIIFIEEKLNLL
tara:strand:- start:3087 stop:3770 length:684 start_codon:yes stop_codon:yes gene_type:complete